MLKKDCTMEEVMEHLQAPFPSTDIEWRVSRSGISNGKQWAMVLAYVDSRAIQNRLDEVFGPAGWQNKFTDFREGVLCTISCYIDGEWVSKTDGAEPTKFESFKGGLSGAIKRAGALWGIGRYLYNLTETFVDVSPTKLTGGTYIKDDKSKVQGYWVPPKLPDWALPENERGKGSQPSRSSQNQNYGNSQAQKHQTGNQSSNQTKQNQTQPNKKQSDGFNRNKVLNDIDMFLKNTGLINKQDWIIPLFKRVNPNIQQNSLSEVGKQATDQELMVYYNVLKPVNDLTLLANHFKVSMEDVLKKYVQMLVPTVKIENLFSCFTYVTIDIVKEVSEMVKEDLQTGALQRIA
ncbi:Rad52/Rad22 family DNA repair protein [Robertmurraya beringensis]|uniref:Rad52/Rad22 family DNA repair protein n=1 Tax=Robertmurraya beringensis TaxID=641660 RepID=A0ABV6KU39_9BACI